MVKITKVRYNIGQLNTFLFRNTQEGRKKLSKFSTSKPNYFFYNFTTNNPRNKAIQKLMNVPATTYSDFFDSLTEEKRSIDLAAIKKPIASY